MYPTFKEEERAGTRLTIPVVVRISWPSSTGGRPMSRRYPSLAEWQDSARHASYDEHRLARHLGVTQRTLQRWWRPHGLGSLEVWLWEQRLPRTVRLLELFGSVKEVASLAGYTDPTLYGRHFKRAHGITPGEYIARFKAVSPWWLDLEMRDQLRAMQGEYREKHIRIAEKWR